MQMKLSIIICVYNEERYISECIESLHLADHPQWEAIVVNDASTDTTLDIIELFARKHTNLRCYSLTHNMRLGNARNFAIMLASGEYIAFLDADDYIDAAVLAEKLRMIDAGTDVLINGHSRLYDHGPSTIAIESGEFSGHAAACLYLRRKFGTWGSCIHIYRRDHVLRNNCLFASGFYYEDVVFCFKALCTAGKVIADPTPFYVYRCNNDGITRGNAATPLHLMSSARLHFDLVHILQTKPEDDKLRVAFARAFNILTEEHLPRMIKSLQQGMHEKSLEFFGEFMHYIKCCDTPFSRDVLAVIQSQSCNKKFTYSNDAGFRYHRFWRIASPLRKTVIWISRVLTRMKVKVLNRPEKDRSG
ncbi:MAG: glycosyltransferase family 2 protein [Betaproteobacteria bacterium]|nr:glycosyltransferase family 2 protein [Betaproteobacteria bacterium]